MGASRLDYEQNNYLNFLRYNNAQFPGTALDLQRHTRLYFYLDNLRTNNAVFGEVGYHIARHSSEGRSALQRGRSGL